MADRTGIEWTDATWNPIRGCSRVSEGCRHCYAEGQAARIIAMDRGRGGADGKGSYDGLLAKGGQWNGKVRKVPELLDQPLRWTKPRLIFVNSMSDLFHEDVPFEFVAAVFGAMSHARQHTFQVLTKRPARMLEFFTWLPQQTSHKEAWVATVNQAEFVCGEDRGRRGSENAAVEACASAAYYKREQIAAGRSLPHSFWPKWPLQNVWIGVSIEDQAAADERIPLLLEVPAAVRWLSMEPLLAPVDLSRWLELGSLDTDRGLSNPGIDWVVVGGESGPKARPMHPQWARDLRDQCSLAGVPFLFKQWGEWAPGECVTRNSGVVPTASLSWEWQFSTENLAREGGHVDDEPDLYRIGKRNAGRLLDGVQHDGYPVSDLAIRTEATQP
jgi:protein gp37